MDYLRLDRHQETSSPNPLFRGEVRTQVLVDVPGVAAASTSETVRLQLVRFAVGAYTRLHTHETDQLLVVTEGEGFVGTTQDYRLVRTGDVVHVHAGEPHYHGATTSTAMAHLSVVTPGALEIVDADWDWPHQP